MDLFERRDKKGLGSREWLLAMLDDPHVQHKLRRVLQVQPAARRYSSAETELRVGRPQEDAAERPNALASQYQAQLAQAKQELEAARTGQYETQARLKQVEAQLTACRSELAQAQQALASEHQTCQQQVQAAQRETDAARRDLRQAQARAEQASQEAAQRETQLRQRFNADMDKLQQENDALEEQLGQRFATGWELYRRWGELRPASQHRLASVYPQTGFMSFICGAAQDEALGRLWDEMSQCLQDGASDDLTYLQKLFRYALQLVNASKTEPVYALAEDAAGQPYDMDCHTPDASSRAQGQVTQVLLLGYRNLYKEKMDSYHHVSMVRKSIVHVA